MMRIRAFTISLVRSPADADDILQNAYLVLWAKREKYNPESSFFAWACGVVLIEVRVFARKAAREKLLFDTELIETLASEYLEKASDLDSKIAALQKCMAKLDDKDRELLTDRYRSGFKPKELSAQRNCPLPTLYSALSRIRRLLLRCVKSTVAHEALFHRPTPR